MVKITFIDTTGKVVIPPKYDIAVDFADGLTYVVIHGGPQGYVGRDGTEYFAP